MHLFIYLVQKLLVQILQFSFVNKGCMFTRLNFIIKNDIIDSTNVLVVNWKPLNWALCHVGSGFYPFKLPQENNSEPDYQQPWTAVSAVLGLISMAQVSKTNISNAKSAVLVGCGYKDELSGIFFPVAVLKAGTRGKSFPFLICQIISGSWRRRVRVLVWRRRVQRIERDEEQEWERLLAEWGKSSHP